MWRSLLAFLCLIGQAWAGERVLMLGLSSAAPIPPELSESFRKGVTGGLEGAGFEVVPEEELRKFYDRRPDLARCASVSCFTETGALLGATRVIEGGIQTEENNYRFTLRLIDLPDGALLAQEDSCDVCTLREAADALSLSASSLIGRAAAEGKRRAPRVFLRSIPTGAKVYPSGSLEPVATTPTILALPVGAHAFTLEYEGHLPTPVEIKTRAGRAENVVVALDTGEDRRRPWALAGVGAGAAAVLAGGALILFSGASTSAQDFVGAGLVGVGVVGVAAGALVVWRVKHHR